MRIDAYNKVNQLYQTSRTKKLVKEQKVSGSDSFEISQVGKDYQIAKKAVQNAPDIRDDKVNSIKTKMASGNYNVSVEEVAEKLVKQIFS